MKLLDYMFYRVYTYVKAHRKIGKYIEIEPGMEIAVAYIVPVLLLITPIGYSIAALGLWPDMPSSRYGKYPYIILLISPFIHRYFFNKKITANDYKVFRDKWGNIPAKTRRKHNIIILIVFIVNVILFPLTMLVLDFMCDII